MSAPTVTDHDAWQEMVGLGLATSRPYALAIDSTCFRLTPAGAEAALAPGEHP